MQENIRLRSVRPQRDCVSFVVAGPSSYQKASKAHLARALLGMPFSQHSLFLSPLDRSDVPVHEISARTSKKK